MGFFNGDKKGKHYWLTPPTLMEALQKEFGFDFDACPYPLPEGFNGLEEEWGESTYVNPPFTVIQVDGKKAGFTAWARKAIWEYQKGKKVVMVFPIHRWIHYLVNAGAELRSLGNVRWHSIEDNEPQKAVSNWTMAFILDPEKRK